MYNVISSDAAHKGLISQAARAGQSRTPGDRDLATLTHSHGLGDTGAANCDIDVHQCSQYSEKTSTLLVDMNISTKIDACCNFHENVMDFHQNTVVHR